MQMEMYMKENGRMIKRMVLESICIQMEHSTKVSGKKINSMELVKKLGQMVLVMKEIM